MDFDAARQHRSAKMLTQQTPGAPSDDSGQLMTSQHRLRPPLEILQTFLPMRIEHQKGEHGCQAYTYPVDMAERRGLDEKATPKSRRQSKG
jgi:hypothetical protein